LRVTVRYFASIREEVGLEREEVEVQEGSTVRDLLEALREARPELRGRRKLLVAVNGVRSGPERRLREGDIVALLPSVSGG